MVEATASPEVAYYYPAPYWAYREVDLVKPLLLFFDEIAILRPRYMHGIERLADPVLAGPLQDLGLLRVLEPESFVDQTMTEDLATALVHLITEGAFDSLDRSKHFQELSQSRMGWNADVDLAAMLVEELVARDLARPSQDGWRSWTCPLCRCSTSSGRGNSDRRPTSPGGPLRNRERVVDDLHLHLRIQVLHACRAVLVVLVDRQRPGAGEPVGR